MTTHNALPLRRLYVDVSAPSPTPASPAYTNTATHRPGTAVTPAVPHSGSGSFPGSETPARGATAPATFPTAAWTPLSPVPQGPLWSPGGAGGRGSTGQARAPLSAGMPTRDHPTPAQRPHTTPHGDRPRPAAPSAAPADPVPKALHLLKRAQTTGDLSKRGTLLSSAVSTCEGLGSALLTRHMPSARKKGDGLGAHRQKAKPPPSVPAAHTFIDPAKWSEILR